MHCTKYLFLLFSLFTTNLWAQTCKNAEHKHQQYYKSGSSSLANVLHYKIDLNILDFANKTIIAQCDISWVALEDGVTEMEWDLTGLQVDSVMYNGSQVAFQQFDSLLVTPLSGSLSNGDTSKISIYYHGSPVQDPSGFGGWYWQGNYAFNIGVGFEVNPHNLGKVWHPCIDDFTQRATYEISLLTDGGKKGYANGMLLSEEEVTTGVFKNVWSMTNPIPTYLACVAIAPYTRNEQSFQSITGREVPIYLIAESGDQANLSASFEHLPDALDAFEASYGPYVWQKVGYHLVPFSSGAMEHATSIAYPQAIANGNLSYETLMAHELAHHWWGDLVTCETAGDMWINEGMAAYSERLFLEYVYGRERYIRDIKNNHIDVLKTAHINDGGIYAIHGVPSEITYGDHSYNKGADVAHNMRAYLGEEHFENAWKYFITKFAGQHANAYDFRDALNEVSTKDMNSFFEDWVFGKGYSTFVVDSSKAIANGNGFEVTLFVQQKLRHANQFHSEVPVDFVFVNESWEKTVVNAEVTGQYQTISFNLDFNPDMILVNETATLSLASTGETSVINRKTVDNLSQAEFRLKSENVTDSLWAYVNHHWVAPDQTGIPTGYILSQERFWEVNMLIEGSADLSGRVYYSGRQGDIYGQDTLLTQVPGFTEDSLVVMYKPLNGNKWVEWREVVHQKLSSTTDGNGFFDIENLQPGFYTYAIRDGAVGIKKHQKQTTLFLNVYPNPAQKWVTIEMSETLSAPKELEVYNIEGKLMDVLKVNRQKRQWNVEHLPAGAYYIRVADEGIEAVSFSK